MALSVSTVLRPNLIGGGVGIVQIGAVTTPPSGGLNLQDLGSIEGNISEVITREVLEVWDKQPQVLTFKKVIKEQCKISFSLKELWIEDINRFLGFDPSADVTPEVSTSELITDEQKVLWGTYPVRLYGRDITSGAPADFVVSSAAGGGGTVYTNSVDYDINLTEGVIQRTATSTIPDGGRVYIKYTWIIPKRKYFSVGGALNGDTSDYFLRIIYVQPDGNRQIFDYYKVIFDSPLVLVQKKRGINGYPVNLTALADLNKSAGNYYGRRYYEYTNAA